MEYKIKNINEYSKNDINNFYNRLYSKKRNKVNKYKRQKNKISSIIGDMILSEILITYSLSYDNLDFAINENGKPYIKNENYYFSISHSFDYIITTVSKKNIGIDIEKIRETQINTINYFATESEKKYILSSNTNIEERIFKIYTLKEAYFKMKGANLNEIFSVEFKIENDNVYCSDDNVRVGFINDIKGYIISYCEEI